MAPSFPKRGDLTPKRGRPACGALGSFSSSTKNQILALRKLTPGGGPKSILAEYKGEEPPSARSIAYFLKEKGLSARYERHSDIDFLKVPKAVRPHELWQMDARGNEQVDGVGTVCMINIKDVCSGVYVGSFPVRMKSAKSFPNTADYQAALRLAFMEFGLPENIQTDRASVFFDNNSKSPFPARIHLWLAGMGIRPGVSRPHRPTDQAHVERSHQTCFRQMAQGIQFKNWEALLHRCAVRKDFLNWQLPSRSHGDKPPLVANPEAIHSGRHYHPEAEQALILQERVYECLGQYTWYRKASKNRQVNLGKKVYYLPEADAGNQLSIHFEEGMLVFTNQDGKTISKLEPKKCDAISLMGECPARDEWAGFQMKIPFSWKDQRLDTIILHST